MNDPPVLLRPGRPIVSHSPTRNRHAPATISDEFLRQLAPPTAVDSLASPTGALKACLDGASASERDFTTRTAVASNMIWGWVEELQHWRWPSDGGSAGFRSPTDSDQYGLGASSRKSGKDDTQYLGSLPAADVTLFEARVEQIRQDMEELEVEDIKSHVMTNHILPLSRPTTPVTGMRRSSPGSGVVYNRMDDLSAVVTAIVIQTLPNLAKLARLLQVWSSRLRVLEQIPRLLLSIQDAEVALQSGWNAITTPSKLTPRQNSENTPSARSLSNEHFLVMKSVVEKKVAKAGRTADLMLDCLEGQADTLPDEWLDRLESAEASYASWVAASERQVQQTELAQMHKSSSQKPPSLTRAQPGHSALPLKDSANLDQSGINEMPLRAAEKSANGESDQPVSSMLESPKGSGQSTAQALAAEADMQAPAIRSQDGHVQMSPFVARDSTVVSFSETTSSTLSPDIFSAAQDSSKDTLHDFDDESDQGVDDGDEMELPPLRDDSRRNSITSEASTVLHGASSHFAMSSDIPEVSASPGVRKAQVREAGYASDSPPSSPPLPRESSNHGSTFEAEDLNVVRSMANATDAQPESSFVEDNDDSISISDTTSPSKRRESSGDIQLREQISQIIQDIPARIKLTNETPNINLNPPDLQLPKMRKKPSIDRFRRSGSALSTMSSRAGTPAFTLSPAKNGRPRNHRGQQEIKVYHLSRSNGEAPIKLFIRCVGENGERVMVRVGGGWADLSEYLKEYASHHKRRSAATDNPKVEVNIPRIASGRHTAIGSSPPSRPASALDSPMTPLKVRKARRSSGAVGHEVPRLLPKTPAALNGAADDLNTIPQSEESLRSRSSSRLSWVEDDSSFLGLAGPMGKRIEMSDENKAWVESVKEKVRMASGERKTPPVVDDKNKGRFGELGKVGGTKRLFRKSEDLRKK